MKRAIVPMADLLDRESRLAFVSEIFWRYFGLRFTDEQKQRFLQTGTFKEQDHEATGIDSSPGERV